MAIWAFARATQERLGQEAEVAAKLPYQGKPYENYAGGMAEWVVRAWPETGPGGQIPRDFLVATQAPSLAISRAQSHEKGSGCQGFKILCGPFKTSTQESQVLYVVQDGEVIWTSIPERSEGGDGDGSVD